MDLHLHRVHFLVNHYFADVATDASYDRQAVINFLRAECNTSDAENYIISDYEVYT